MENENEEERKRALIFLGRKTTIHVSKKNGFFCNGIILEVGDDFFVIKDRIGGHEHFILFSELKKPLEPYKEKDDS